MRYILIVLLFLSTLYGAKSDIFKLYQNRQYEQACKEGKEYLADSRNDEEYVNLYAFACLKADWIDSLATPITMLKYSKEARNNASYFSVILMQKKLLYSALLDGLKVQKLNLPSTKHDLSKVFDLYASSDQNSTDGSYYFSDSDDPKITYKLYIIDDTRVKKMVIEVYYDKMLKNRHMYW